MEYKEDRKIMAKNRNMFEYVHGNDFVEYYIFPRYHFNDTNEIEQLNLLITNVNTFLEKYTRDYIWHCEPFNLIARTSNTTLLNNDNETGL